MQPTRVAWALVLLMLATSALAQASFQDSPYPVWRTELVTIRNDAGGFMSETPLVIDASGTTFAAWYADGQGVVFAELGPAGWATEVIDPQGRAATLALDAEDRLHLVWRSGSFTLRHAYREAGAWHELSDFTFPCCHDPGWLRSAIDQSGVVHLVFTLAQNVTYARIQDDAWTIETVSGGMFSTETDIAVSPSGDVHIVAMSTQRAGKLYAVYLYQDVGGWAEEEIAEGGFPTIGIDASGRLHVAYRIPSDNKLDYATKMPGGTAWETETVDNGVRVNFLRLDVTPAGVPHIIVSERVGGPLAGEILHVTRELGEWKVSTIDYEGVSLWVSIALGPDGVPRVLYNYVFDEVARVVPGHLRFAEPVNAVPARLAAVNAAAGG